MEKTRFQNFSVRDVPSPEEIETLTRLLIKTASVNGTPGERDIADKIYEVLTGLPYFKEHSGNVWTQPLPGDHLGRKNVFAFVEGGKCSDGTTVVLMGHTDTVGIDDFGPLKEFAFDSDRLVEEFAKLPLPEDVKKDLASGDWLFGRGANDMKSGLAVHITVMERFSRRAPELRGNLLFVASPVEENQHTGIMTALSDMIRLREEKGLRYLVSVNNDFTSPLYDGDPSNYVYLGASGKLLPCFYIVGKETHVGHAFEGLDPSLIAANIVGKIDLNTELSDSYNGDYTMAPALLKLKDLKESYNVQTPISTFLYFNYYVNDISVSGVTALLKKKAEEAFADALSHLAQNKRLHCELTGLPYSDPEWAPKVMTFEELCSAVESDGISLSEILPPLAKELTSQGCDAREICMKSVQKVYSLWKEKTPVVIFFYSPPYCPHNTLKSENPEEKNIIELVRQSVEATNEREHLSIQIKQFYPNLSDSSYIKIDDDRQSLSHLVDNCPNWNEIYNVPFDAIKTLNIPAVTLGCYGKDAHKMAERLYKPYSFGSLPRLMADFIGRMIG